MSRRSVFSPPPDDALEDVFSSLTSSPRPRPEAVPTVVPDDVPLPARATPAAAPAAELEPVRVLTQKASAVPREERPAPRVVKVQEKAKAAGRGKRVGLYLQTGSWASLKEIGLDRARNGLPPDFTTIVLDALKKQYPSKNWGV